MILEFFTFECFISTWVLMAFYPMGAVLLPVLLIMSGKKLFKKFIAFDAAHEFGKEIAWRLLTTKQKIRFILIFAACLIFMEIFWRMLFEFLMAYIQIRDALVLARI